MTPEARHIKFTNGRACSYGENKVNKFKIYLLSTELIVL